MGTFNRTWATLVYRPLSARSLADAPLSLIALPRPRSRSGALLRSPLARRLVAAPRGDRWHDRRRRSSAASASSPASSLRSRWRCAAGASSRRRRAARHPRRLRDPLPRRPRRRRPARCRRSRSSARQFAAAAIVLATGPRVEIVGNDVLAPRSALLWLVGHDERVQPARQHGRPRRDAGRDRRRLLRDRRRRRSTENAVVLVLSLALALRLRRASSRSTSGRAGRAAIFMGDSGSQVLGFVLAALGLARAGRSPGRPSRRCSCRCSSSRCRSSTRRSSRSCGCSRGGPIYQGGRDHSSHRLVRYGLSERRAVVLLARRRRGARRDEPRLHRPRRPAGHARRACCSPSSCSSSSRASSPTSSAGRGASADARAAARRSTSTGAGWSRCSSTSP